MKSRPLLLCLALVATGAAAQGKPTLIDYPLHVKLPVPAAKRYALQDDFRQLVVRNVGVLVATRTTWSAALAAHKRQDCDVRNGCLQQLAVAAGTLYALYAAVEQNAAGTEVIASGRIVNQDGAQVRAPLSVTVPVRTTATDAAREALSRLLAGLDLDRLPSVLTAARPEPPPPPPLPPSEPPPPSTSAPLAATPQSPPSTPATAVDAPLARPDPVEPPLLPPPATTSTLHSKPLTPGLGGARVAGMVLGGVALAGGVAAVVLGVTALDLRSKLPPGDQFTNDAHIAGHQQVNRLATMSLIAGVTAGAAAVASLVAFVASSGTTEATPAVSLSASPAGANLVLSGHLP
jgi:hypothetical protein